MLKRKRAKKKRPHNSPSLSPEEEVLLNSLLEDLRNIGLDRLDEQIPSPQLAHALVERIPADDPGFVDLLLAIRDAFDQKEIQKAIKKTIYRFKQRGIALPDLDPPNGPSPHIVKAEKVEPSSYIGPIDRVGSRGVFVVLPQIPKGADVGMGVVNDEKGITQFFFGRFSKRRMREVKDLFFENTPHMVKTSISHIATILERSHSLNEHALRDSSSDYLHLRPWILENVSLLDRSAIYDFMPLRGVSEEILSESRLHRLFEHELMKSWIMDREEIMPLMERVLEAKESRILVSEAQKSEHIKGIREKGVAQLFPDPKRLIIKHRLEEMAYIFLRLDDEEYATISLSAAISLDKKDTLLGANPFLRAMLERSLAFYIEASREINESKGRERDSSSGIIMP